MDVHPTKNASIAIDPYPYLLCQQVSPGLLSADFLPR